MFSNAILVLRSHAYLAVITLLSKLQFPFRLLFHTTSFYTLKSASTQKNWSIIERNGFSIAAAGFRRTSRNYGFHRNRAI